MISALEIARVLGGRRTGGSYLVQCPAHADRNPSLSIRAGEEGRIHVHCFAGCDKHSVKQALRQMRLWPSPEDYEPTATELLQRRRQDADRAHEQARRDLFVDRLWRATWDEARPAPSTPIENWLRVRGIDPDVIDLGSLPLRWSPSCPIGRATAPAMLALMTDPVTSEPTGLHRTYLLPNGSAKAPVSSPRMMLGKAGIIRLNRDEEVELGLGVCEGVENGLSIMAWGWRPIWAMSSLGMLTRFPVLGGIEHLTIFADPKPHEIEGACACARRWIRAGKKASVRQPVEPGLDFNDLHRRDAV